MEPIKIIQATFWIYKKSFRSSVQCVASNWVVSFAPLVYGVLLSVASFILAPLGIIGGVLIALAADACISSGLFLIENMVKAGRANFNDFLAGFPVYLWEVVRISFILWIPMMVASAALGSVPNGLLLFLFIQIVLYVLLNAVPEFIYQSRSSGIELLASSYNFIIENWIEWFLPNIVITAAGYFVLKILNWFASVLPPIVGYFVVSFGFGLCLAYFMVFRGFLFSELNGSTRRSRIYRFSVRGAD